jgi:hypothetical protein
MKLVHKAQRILLGLFALWAGAAAVIGLILPRQLLHEVFNLSAMGAVIFSFQLYGGARLGLAVTALIAAFMAKPPRALVWAVAIGVFAEFVGTMFSNLLGAFNPTEWKSYSLWVWSDLFFALTLAGTQLARRLLRK